MLPKLSRLEVQIMQALWDRGPLSVRDIQETFPPRKRPTYGTLQSTMTRLEAKHAVRLVRKISNAHVFEAIISRKNAQGRFIDDLLGIFGGRVQPLMTRLVETGKLTMDDLRKAEQRLQDLTEEEEK